MAVYPGSTFDPRTGEREVWGRGQQFLTYKPYSQQVPGLGYGQFPTFKIPTEPPETPEMPTYEPGGGQYPMTPLPTYQPTGEAYPGYKEPETGGVRTELQESIRARMAGEGTAGAESAIYERGEERVNREYEEGLTRIDEEMTSRGLTGSGIHGEAINKLKEQKQRSLADLSRQITIYGQQAIESAMGRAQQYVEGQAAEAARELGARERGWQGRVGERIRGYESEARAAEAKGQQEQAAYQTAIAERVRVYEAQARAARAKTETSMQKWQIEAQMHMQRYNAELQKAQALYQAKMTAYQMGREEYRRVYESKYQATRDRYQSEQYAREAAERKAQTEWERKQVEIEQQMKFNIARGPKPTPSTAWRGGYPEALAAWERGVNISNVYTSGYGG